MIWLTVEHEQEYIPQRALSMKMHATNHPAVKAGRGALKGSLLAKNDEKGNIPSRPSSWITEFRVWLV